jgi:hypothetical protein
MIQCRHGGSPLISYARREHTGSSLLVESGQGPFDNAVKRRGFCRL